MSSAIENYRNVVDQPWGRMFYDLIYRQLNISSDKRMRLLDFGAGFCLTADHYAKDHDVTAVEPNEEMYNLRVKENDYSLIPQGIEYLKDIEDGIFDAVICHNVLEYVDDIDAVLRELERALKPGGILSVVKHNDLGRALSYAVLNDNPRAALELLSQENPEDSMFGNRSVYTTEYLADFYADKMTLTATYGLRTFFGLSSNSDIKFTDEWYESMLELEMKASTIDEFRKIAFFNHLIFTKLTLQ